MICISSGSTGFANKAFLRFWILQASKAGCSYWLDRHFASQVLKHIRRYFLIGALEVVSAVYSLSFAISMNLKTSGICEKRKNIFSCRGTWDINRLQAAWFRNPVTVVPRHWEKGGNQISNLAACIYEIPMTFRRGLGFADSYLMTPRLQNTACWNIKAYISKRTSI